MAGYYYSNGTYDLGFHILCASVGQSNTAGAYMTTIVGPDSTGKTHFVVYVGGSGDFIQVACYD